MPGGLPGRVNEAFGRRPARFAAASVLVERDSQKPIIIGRGGEMIKTIGTAARQELERFFDARVFLDLHVKVKGEWREDERVLDELLKRPGE